jgi:hypothetical protein
MANQLLVGFGLHLKKLRLEKGLSQERLGMIAELDRTYISGSVRNFVCPKSRLNFTASSN